MLNASSAGASAVNHEAKRAISNAMTWMGEIERLVIPKFESAQQENYREAIEEPTKTLKEIVVQVL